MKDTTEQKRRWVVSYWTTDHASTCRFSVEAKDIYEAMLKGNPYHPSLPQDIPWRGFEVVREGVLSGPNLPGPIFP